MQAKAGDVLFRIADLSVVWVLADVAERDLGLIAPGQTVAVIPRGYPGRTFAGKISLIYPVLNKETRTARVRIELANPEGILRPNMYADTVIESGGGALRSRFRKARSSTAARAKSSSWTRAMAVSNRGRFVLACAAMAMSRSRRAFPKATRLLPPPTF